MMTNRATHFKKLMPVSVQRAPPVSYDDEQGDPFQEVDACFCSAGPTDNCVSNSKGVCVWGGGGGGG